MASGGIPRAREMNGFECCALYPMQRAEIAVMLSLQISTAGSAGTKGLHPLETSQPGLLIASDVPSIEMAESL
jgi:hypothetical protein